jgi:glycosyltransferase involved in cell wall biosynthesis
MLVSVVIPNYNYAEFIAEAIDSALGLDWPEVEVIVVDDGSTDDSRAIIEGYGDRIATVFQRNAGHAAACSAGFGRSRGEVVLFLDSDDRLHPSLVRELAAVWRPGISKVQFQMNVVDAKGKPTGSVLPQYYVVPTPEDVRSWAMTAAAYPTPPGSGNAYARDFLERIFPLDEGERAADSYCLAAAPYLGDVVTIAKPLVFYRIHGRNDGAMSTLDVTRFATELRRAQWRFRYAQRIASSVGMRIEDEVFGKSMPVLSYRLASLRLDPARHPIANDSAAKVLRDAARASLAPQGVGRRARITLLAWAGLVTFSPPPVSKRLVLWRFASTRRPAALRRLLRLVGAAPRRARAVA